MAGSGTAWALQALNMLSGGVESESQHCSLTLGAGWGQAGGRQSSLGCGETTLTVWKDQREVV